MRSPSHRRDFFRSGSGDGGARLMQDGDGLSWRKPAMRRPASSAVNPHMPMPPRPPALLTAAASVGVVISPIGAKMIGNLSFKLSVREFDGHI
jgi:hypothetical protein